MDQPFEWLHLSHRTVQSQLHLLVQLIGYAYYLSLVAVSLFDDF